MTSEKDSDRRTLAPEAMARLELLVTEIPVIENAFRLMSDAGYLHAGSRYASAVALAVLSQEEIGKYLLELWSVNPGFAFDRRRLHESKQRAVAALFMADSIRTEYQKRNVDFSDLGSPEKMRVLAEAIDAGCLRVSNYVGNVRAGVIQHVKHSGLYFDDALASKGIEPSKITSDHADGLIRDCSRAFMILVDQKAVGIAGELYTIVWRQNPQKGENA